MQAVGGRVPEVIFWREARVEERLITRGEGERRRRGRRWVVRAAGEVRFVERVVVWAVRREVGFLGEGLEAMAALLIRTVKGGC